MNGITTMAFWDELEKIGQQARSPSSPWKSKTVGAPRSKTPPRQEANAPTLPGKLGPKLVTPGSQYGKQDYSQPNVATPPPMNPAQGQMERSAPPPNVVFGVR